MSRVLRHEGFIYVGKAIEEQKILFGQRERERVCVCVLTLVHKDKVGLRPIIKVGRNRLNNKRSNAWPWP